MSVVEFQNSKSQIIQSWKEWEILTMWEKTYLICNFISFTTTFTTEAYQEFLKIQKSPLNCDTKKVLYLLKCKTFGEAPYLWNTKTKFCYRLNNYNSKYRVFRKVTKKFFRNVFMLTTVSMATVELMIGNVWFLNNLQYISSWKKEKRFGTQA